MEIKEWGDLSSGQQRAVLGIAAVETVLTVAALVDLARRPAEEVRGPKAMWAVLAFVQPVGPATYFLAGRR